MALASVYQQFLAAPNSSLLTEDACLFYVTSTTTFKGATEVIKHYNSVRNQLKKKKEAPLSTIEGRDAIAAEFETSVEFVTSGGPYLPGLDDNFLADRTVTIPIMHIVTFDPSGKIARIRQTWDQGSLLKQVEVIGRSGRNWPIRDSKAQIQMIESCVKSSDTHASQNASSLPVRSRDSSTHITRDPHASLSLFGSREELEQGQSSVISPKAGSRPRQRNFSEILGDEDDETPGSPSEERGRSMSPSKAAAPKAGTNKHFQPSRLFDDEIAVQTGDGNLPQDASVAPKAGAGKNFQPSRLFDADEAVKDTSSEDGRSPQRFVKLNPKKYEHFDFADGSDPQDAPKAAAEPTPRKTKHSSQWDFDDFVTPQKKPSKGFRQHDVRHWGADDEASEEPTAQQQNVKPRRDAEAHFDFVDDGATPPGEARTSRPRGATQNDGMGLYKNNVYDEEADAATPANASRTLGNITNLKDRGRDFEPHFAMTDNSPAESSRATVGDDRKKAVKMMDANWSMYDTSPVQKENKGIAIAGDGMGGGKGSTRNWIFGEDDDESSQSKPAPGRKLGAAQKSGGFNWDF